MAKLTFVTSAYNEEKKLEDCLKSVKDITDEIIVINSGSTDKTVEIAKKYTKNVFTRENNLMLNVNKNYGFSKAENEWILNLDADERLTPELAKEIRTIVENDGGIERDPHVANTPQDDKMVNGYYIARKNIIFGKWIENSIWWPDYQLRLFRKGKGKFAEKHVHELVEVEGKTETLKNPMIHLNYDSVSQYLRKLDNIYTNNEAENSIKEGKQIHPMDAIKMPVQDFIKTFFSQKGYKDGLHGLVLSLLQAFYSLIVFAKIWEKEGFKEYNSKNFLSEFMSEVNRLTNEFKYWFISILIENTKSPFKKIGLKIKRRIILGKIK